MQFSNPMYKSDFLHQKMASKDLGDFEIRILRFKKEYDEKYLEYLQHEFRLLSWFYSRVTEFYPQRVPLTYHFRILPNSKTHPPSHCFDIQEYAGGFFLETIASDLLKYRSIELNKQIYMLYSKNKDYLDAGRGSIVAFMWGIQLA